MNNDIDLQPHKDKQSADTEASESQSIVSASSNSYAKLMTAVIVIVVVAIAVVAGTYAVVHKKPTNKLVVAALARVAPAEVAITNTGFVPQTITVKLGQAVIWTNKDKSPHVIASDPYPKDNTLPGLNSKQEILASASYSYVFSKVGTYSYHDNLNPYTFEGIVIVKN